MAKRKRKLTAAQKAEKKRRRQEFMTIFIRGKMKRVRRPPTIEGMDVDEFIRRNADPIWLHQNEMWEELHALEPSEFPELPEQQVLEELEELEDTGYPESLAEQEPPETDPIDRRYDDFDIPF